VPSVRDKLAPRLQYRHDREEPYKERYLQYDELTGEWSATVAPIDVRNGFWYRVAAGDSQSGDYRVQIRATPLITEFLATYKYRPYTGWPQRTRSDRKLEALRGTEVAVVVHSNHPVKEGRLEVEAGDGPGQTIRGQGVAGEPNAVQFDLTLERSGKYRIRF